MEQDFRNPQYVVAPASGQDVAAATARFMSRVYGWMAVGLLVTGLVAWNVATSESMVQLIFGNRGVVWVFVIAQLGLVFVLSGLFNRLSAAAMTGIFLGYAALTGVTLSSVFLIYAGDSIAGLFGVTAIAFAGLAAVGNATKRDLSGLGQFCIMGLFGLIGFAVLSRIVPGVMGPFANFAFAIVGIIVFSGLTVWDAQRIKAKYDVRMEGTELVAKLAIYGALEFYLDFVNLFLSLLRLFGRRR